MEENRTSLTDEEIRTDVVQEIKDATNADTDDTDTDADDSDSSDSDSDDSDS